MSVKKTDRVVVTGRLRVRDWTAGDRSGTNVEVEAEALGHDLSWGTAAFSRSMSVAASEPATDAVPDAVTDAATEAATEGPVETSDQLVPANAETPF